MKPIADRLGYTAGPREFSVAQLNESQFDLMQTDHVPLGFEKDLWRQCVSELRNALETAGLADADVRLRGSSARFFCGWHKRFPKSEQELLESKWDCATEDEVLAVWAAFGYKGEPPDRLPNFHYFDSRYRLLVG